MCLFATQTKLSERKNHRFNSEHCDVCHVTSVNFDFSLIIIFYILHHSVHTGKILQQDLMLRLSRTDARLCLVSVHKDFD